MHLSRLASRALYWGATSTGVIAVLQIVQLAVLARLLTPTEFGLAAMMTVVIGLANAYGDLGLSNAVLTHSPLNRRVLSSLYWIGVVAGMVLAGVVFLVAPLAARAFSQPDLTALIRWAALGFVIAPLGLQFQLLLQRNLEFGPLARVDVSSNAFGVATTVISAWQGAGVFSLVIGSLAGATVRALAYLAIGSRRWPVARECSLQEAGELIGFGAFQLGERTVSYIARNLDKAVVGWLLGASALGLYNTAYQLMQKPLQLIQPLATRIATPLYVHIREDRERLVSAYLLVVELSASALFPVFGAMFVLAEPLVLVVLGADWIRAAPILRWMSLLGCFYAVGFPLGSLLLARRRADWSFWLNTWRLVPFSVAIFFGTRFGLVGVAIALVVAQALGGFGVGFWVRSKLGVPGTRFLRALAAPTLIALASSLVVAAWVPFSPPHSLTQLTFGMAIFGGCYAGAFLLARRPFLMRVWAHLGLARGARPGKETG